MQGAKESHNRYWAKRMVYEGAGWPDALDKETLRAHIRGIEHASSDAWDGVSDTRLGD